jgi:hypothetical protein
MIKNFLCTILFLVSISTYAQFTTTIQWQKVNKGNAGDTIYYDLNRKLNWVDFKGQPDVNSVAAAITESGFGYNMIMQSLNGKTNLVITVSCYFNKNKSWVKPDMNKDYALLHEQHHFDITFINACLFIKKLRAVNFTLKNYNSLINDIHDECFAALEKMQNEYDGETKNGRINQQQVLWNKKIDRQLNAIITN